ncbi:MAG TPA: carboxymuconolactone decarboxylase family protein [Trebonia sp.]|nr:carboxymuconolactone decarboxylase family protein [Trebonia sp.]
MDTNQLEKQAYIDEMVRRRGYVLDYHKVMVQQDLPVLKAADALVSAAYLEQRLLDRKTKELIFIVSLTVMRAEKPHITSHIRAALKAGATPEEILEAIEISLPEAGVVAFQWGVDAWREVVQPAGIEPSAAIAEAARQ